MALQESPPPSLQLASGHDHQRALVERAQRGDAAAQRALYETNVERVYRLAFRLSGRDDVAREMTQDAFVRAFQRLGEFRSESAFSTWLHTIAVSVTLNEVRRRKRVHAREASLLEASSVEERQRPSDPIMRERIAEAVATLPDKQRMVFLMHDAEGFTHEEIATTLGVAVGTSKAQLSYARAKLRAALAGYEEEWKP
jgi:RNA polymerase sigma-70 factor (ECF subfamily)